MQRAPRPKPGRDAPYWLWWLRRESKALLLGAGLLAFALGITSYGLKQTAHPAETFEATLIRFGTSSHDDGNAPLVLVRIPSGQIRQLHAHRSRLVGCRAGETIRLVRRGALLAVDPSGCGLNRRS